MTFDEAETACKKIVELGEELLQFPSADVARTLEQRCGDLSARMRGSGLGNVSEQLVRVIAATKKYQKVRGNVTEAGSDLRLAIERVRIALVVRGQLDQLG